MPLTPTDQNHALQIQSGTIGRRVGHAFEDRLSVDINSLSYPLKIDSFQNTHVIAGRPSQLLLAYIASLYRQNYIEVATAISTGALATSEEGRKWLEVNGTTLRRCKSDIIVNIIFTSSLSYLTIGVSVKQCNAKTPTNAQLYFTTAQGFSNLLANNGIPVSVDAVAALRQFCGEPGFRPMDFSNSLIARKTDPRRYFWEEISPIGRKELEGIFTKRQDEVTRLLLQKAYLDDPFAPDILLHKTKRSDSWENSEIAIYTIDELVNYSREYASFATKPYSVRKGSYRDPEGITHLAPRFGIVQMQRGGQVQHPDQLQFNLEAGYFYKIKNIR